MRRLLLALRSPWVRGSFLLVAVAAAVVAVARSWDQVRPALSGLGPAALAGALALSLAYLLASMLAWRAVAADLGSRLGGRATFSLFFVSQLGKYVPGGLWNIVAVSEMGADRGVPRRTTVTAMGVALLVSIASGLAFAVGALGLGPPEVSERFGWVVWLLPVVLVLLFPPVLNRCLGLALRIARRPALERPLRSVGALRAVGWSVLAWCLAGAQVWLLAVATGMRATPGTYAIAAGGYALAWIVGFVVVLAPAGVGAREVVLIALLASVLDTGGVLVVAVVSRVLLTVADLTLAGVGALLLRPRRRAAA